MLPSSTGLATRSAGKVKTSPPRRWSGHWGPTSPSRSAPSSVWRFRVPAAAPEWRRSSCAKAPTSTAKRSPRPSTRGCRSTHRRCMCWPAATRAMCRSTRTTPKTSRTVSDRRAERPGPECVERALAVTTRRGAAPWLHARLRVRPERRTRALKGHHGRVQSTLCGRPVSDDRPLIMAIVNRTPDSFYDRGANFTDDAARAAAGRLIGEGADVIDVGGVKAGPGESIDAQAEIARVVPFIEWLREAFPDQLISIDTWRSEVARLACRAGADLINDSWGGYDPAMPEVAAEFGAGLVCSHTGGARPRTRPYRVSYGISTHGVVDDVINEVTSAAERAVAAGVVRDRVLIDPTHDFGKNTFHGLALLRHMEDLVNTGWPILMALSNKDFVGETLGVDLTQRLEGTLAATARAAAAGARMFRVHEVGPTRRVLEMVASIQGQRSPTRTVRGLA